MKKIYKMLGLLLLGTQMFNSQVYTIASDDLYYAGGVNNNGKVSLSTATGYFIWNSTDGLKSIGSISNGYETAGHPCISEDGVIISAAYTNPESGYNEISTYDVESGTWISHGGLLTSGFDGYISSAWGMSEDGSTIVGLSMVSAAIGRAVKWDATNGIVDLGSMVDGRSSRANGINGDKSVIVGWQDMADGYRAAVRWVNGVESYITDNNGNNIGEAGAVSSDGKTIVGYNGIYPYIWNEMSGYHIITHPNSGTFFRGGATGISGDGTKVIGYFRSWPGAPMGGEGFIWTPEGGRQNLNDYVSSLGIDTQGITFALPMAISKDGTKIAGTGISGSDIVAFYIDLSSVLETQKAVKKHTSIYPNPAKNILNIKTDAKIESVEIFSVSGQRVKSLGSVNPINITDLSKGNYIVVISQNGKKESYKFIKE